VKSGMIFKCFPGIYGEIRVIIHKQEKLVEKDLLAEEGEECVEEHVDKC
jgi:hypothetical protein